MGSTMVRPQWWSSGSGKYAIIRDVRPSNTMRSSAPFAVSAAPAEAGHGMGAKVADTVRTYTEGSCPYPPCLIGMCWRHRRQKND